MFLLTCCGSRTSTARATCGRSRTYIRIYFNYDQIFQEFFFSLVDVELVVDVVPIKKHVHGVSIFINTQINQRRFDFRFEIHVFMELRELHIILLTEKIIRMPFGNIISLTCCGSRTGTTSAAGG